MNWIRNNTAKAVAIVVLVALIAGVLFLRSCQAERTAKAGAKLATGQAGASLVSGGDAVDTTGNVQRNEIAADAVTRENDHAIHKAKGAGAPVAAPVRDAGLAALCRRAAYRDSPRCKGLIK
jgi:hypothetical protein